MSYLPRYVDYPDHLTPLYSRGDDGDEPVTEEKIIPAGHGSREFDIVKIGGVIIAKFSFVQIAFRDITISGETGSPDIGMRLSIDGGSTWISGVSDYRSTRYDAASSSSSDDSYGIIADFSARAQSSALIKNLNAVMPTTMISHEMIVSGVNNTRRGVITLNSAVIHDAIQIFIGGGGGTPVFTGGTLDLVGYK